MPNLKNRFMDQVLRLIRRHLRLEVCAVDQVHWHKEPGDGEFNHVTVIMRDRAQEVDAHKKYIRVRIPVLQNLIGGNCGGYNWNPRKGDLVYCFFYQERKGVCLGNFWSWAEYPACRPSPYDIAGKGGQWLEPYQDKRTGDFQKQPYPALEKPYCFPRWFHGPVTGSTGKGRDWMLLFDYCHEGHARKDCSTCKTIDSVNRADNHGFKFYSSETESEKAHPDRGLYFTPGGSYWMFESKCCEDCESCSELGCCSELFTEGKGFWTIQGVVDGQDYKGHLRHSPTGTIDIHSTSEFAGIAEESTGTRVVCVSPSDLTVDYAVQAKDFVTSALREILKNGKIFDSSPSEVKLTAPDIVLDGDVLITGTCTHNDCSCDGEFAALGGIAGGQTLCGGTEEDEELTLCGTSDVSKGQVTIDADLECNGDLCTQIKAAIKAYCDTLYAASAGGVTNGDSHDHSGGDGAQIDHGGLGGLGDDDHSIYLKLGGRTGYQRISGVTQFTPPNFDPAVYGNDFSEKFDSSNNGRGFFVGWNRSAGRGESDLVNHHASGSPGGFRFYEYNKSSKNIDLLFEVQGDGDVYVPGNCSALSFTDRTPGYSGDALAEIKSIVNDAQGRISHKTLPAFARAKVPDPETGLQTDGRNIGNMVSILTKAVQQLTEKLEAAEKKITELEAKGEVDGTTERN